MGTVEMLSSHNETNGELVVTAAVAAADLVCVSGSRLCISLPFQARVIMLNLLPLS